jgi:hypothetical protein
MVAASVSMAAVWGSPGRCRLGGDPTQPGRGQTSRSQQLLRTLKSDERHLGAMAELMVRGGGRPGQTRTDTRAAQLHDLRATHEPRPAPSRGVFRSK